MRKLNYSSKYEKRGKEKTKKERKFGLYEFRNRSVSEMEE